MNPPTELRGRALARLLVVLEASGLDEVELADALDATDYSALESLLEVTEFVRAEALSQQTLKWRVVPWRIPMNSWACLGPFMPSLMPRYIDGLRFKRPT